MDGRVVNDGMIPDGIFEPNATVDYKGTQVNVGGMSYREAYEKGYVEPISAYNYYGNLYDWGMVYVKHRYMNSHGLPCEKYH